MRLAAVCRPCCYGSSPQEASFFTVQLMGRIVSLHINSIVLTLCFPLHCSKVLMDIKEEMFLKKVNHVGKKP